MCVIDIRIVHDLSEESSYKEMQHSIVTKRTLGPALLPPSHETSTQLFKLCALISSPAEKQYLPQRDSI